ncbi:hypothetical protein LCGC14_2671110 [marine sediment metagenome]|uniref:Uncharacterized protein n=1 Tax=marine sediment metagenome TaxID=412755 RepID=A0A0F8ZP36_9ZZZZ
MPLKYKKIELSPFEEIINNYKFIHADYSEGLNYGVALERFEEDGAFLAEHFKMPAIPIPERKTSETYLEFIWTYINPDKF